MIHPYDYIRGLDDMRWCEETTFGSGVAKSLILPMPGHGGVLALRLDYAELSRIHEFSEAEIRAAVGHLVAHDFAQIRHDYEGHKGPWLFLMTPGRRAYEAALRAEQEEKEARRAAKVALRGGQVNRRAIPPEVRQFVLDRDGHKCRHCGSTEDLAMDHIKPWSVGGPDTAENLQALCRSCNSRKGDS